MEPVVDHFQLNELLRDCGSDWNAAQTHGLLCGRLSVAGAEGAKSWFAQVLHGADPSLPARVECESMLDGLYSITSRQLVERQSELVLLLPDDEDPIARRTAAMGLWCEGFLHGLVSEKQNEALKEKLAAEPLADIIKDMLEITRVVAENDEESDEESFTEVVEYLRVAAQLTYEELADLREPAAEATLDTTDTLH